MSAPRQASPRTREMPDNQSTIVAGAVAEVMGNADLVRCVLGHVLADIKEYNARALARAALAWTRVSRAHRDACQSANGAWLVFSRRQFGGGLALLVPNDPRANFLALCRKAQTDHMGLPIFMRFGVTDNESLADALLENDPSIDYARNMSDTDWRVRGWRIRYRIMARHVLRLLSWHPHGKYAPYDVQGMVSYFDGPEWAQTFANCEHRMAAFLYPNVVTDWLSFRNGEHAKALNARKYQAAVRKMGQLLALFRAECA